MLRSFLLAPCLLICLACATPFPFESLEEGMTMVQATEAFGEPSSTRMEELNEEVRLLREEVQLLQEENARIFERLESAVGLSETRGALVPKLEESSTQTLRRLEELVAELDETVTAVRNRYLSGGQGVRSTWVYPHEEARWYIYPFSILMFGIPFLDDLHVEKHEVELRFEGNKLASWETRPVPSVPTTGTYYVYQDPFPSTPFHSNKDTRHHRKGHEHHHKKK